MQAGLAAVLALGCAGVSAATAFVSEHADAAAAYAAQKAGWKKSGGRWWYAHVGAGYAKGWKKIGGKWYLFDKAGWMQTGWRKSGGKWYYLKGSGAMATGWQKVGKEWYLLGPDGAMRSGWQKISGKWYYLEGSGAMASSKWVGNYYLTSSGAMATSRWVGKHWVGADGKWAKGEKLSAGSFAEIAGKYELASGAGFWSTILRVNPDGTFRGNYQDRNAGESSVSYPKGTIRYCSFSGRFVGLAADDAHCFSMCVESLNYDYPQGSEEVIDGVRYLYTGSLGISKGDSVDFYRKGVPVRKLPDAAYRWLVFPGVVKDGVSHTMANSLYNKTQQYGFAAAR